MKKITTIVLLILAFSAVNVHASRDFTHDDYDQYSRFDAAFYQFADWAMTVGKTPEEKELLLVKRRRLRAYRRDQEEINRRSQEAKHALLGGKKSFVEQLKFWKQ